MNSVAEIQQAILNLSATEDYAEVSGSGSGRAWRRTEWDRQIEEDVKPAASSISWAKQKRRMPRQYETSTLEYL